MESRFANSTRGHQPSRNPSAVTVCSLLLVILAGCSTWLPSPTPGENPGIVRDTPTIAAALLTPASLRTGTPIGLSSSLTPTPTFGLVVARPTCAQTPMWGLGDVWANEEVRSRLGCPVGEQKGVRGEKVRLEKGTMLWRPDTNVIYVLFDGQGPGTWGTFAVASSAPSASPSCSPVIAANTDTSHVPPPGRFGELWCANPWLQKRLGWAVAQESGGGSFEGAVQDFELGVLLWDGELCFALRIDDMSWAIY